ncbi:ATP-binding protein [uncultured Lacinutrix sp.]|uniref:sensor histidine kinase n=1 Tax=uncultured Lacinutrix sp. TaxID=574032 RepID=UPI0026349C9C|nr:ATP-binding protein [uncultured Lacinutrix sp.]
MSTSNSEITVTIVISTILLLLFVAVIIYFLFKHQYKRHLHNKEIIELKESFNKILLNSKIEIQEQTLDHISKELHSNISQSASLININLSEILMKCNDDNKENVIETKHLAKQLLSELKSISTALNTDYIMKIGFSRALEKELERVSKSMKYPAIITKNGNAFKLNPEKGIILFRLCQEVINNIINYANATRIIVNLNYAANELVLEIEDNGIGFNINNTKEQIDKKGSTGMINMNKRAKVINATLSISSEINKGTKVSIRIPK